MALRKQPRSIARELALLSISQVKTKQGKLVESDLDSLVLAAIRTLTIEVQDNLEAASGEIKRGEERLLNSETRASDLDSAKVMIQEALTVSQSAINRVGLAVEFPEFLQLTNKEQVRQYATELIVTVNDYRQEIEAAIEEVLVGWQLSRLPRIDRDILRISVAEMLYLQVPEKVAINESVELAKRYSDEDGFRFLNGVLRRLSDRRKGIISDPSEILEIPEMIEKVEITPTKETKAIAEIPPKSAIEAPQILTSDQPMKNLPIIQQTAHNQDQV
jgi:transcription antitermination protein NusB